MIAQHVHGVRRAAAGDRFGDDRNARDVGLRLDGGAARDHLVGAPRDVGRRGGAGLVPVDAAEASPVRAQRADRKSGYRFSVRRRVKTRRFRSGAGLSASAPAC